MPDDLLHEKFGVEYPIFFWHHSSSHGKDGSKHSQVEENGTMGSDFKVKSKVWIDNRRQQQNTGKRASNEGHESNDIRTASRKPMLGDTDLITKVVFSLGNWLIYILAVG